MQTYQSPLLRRTPASPAAAGLHYDIEGNGWALSLLDGELSPRLVEAAPKCEDPALPADWYAEDEALAALGSFDRGEMAMAVDLNRMAAQGGQNG